MTSKESVAISQLLGLLRSTTCLNSYMVVSANLSDILLIISCHLSTLHTILLTTFLLLPFSSLLTYITAESRVKQPR